MTIQIVTDSTCDLPEKVIKDLRIEVVPLFINIGNKGFADGINLTREEFYENLASYKRYPSTATPGIPVFSNVFEKLADEGAQQIISIHISESLSATINVARTAADQSDKVRLLSGILNSLVWVPASKLNWLPSWPKRGKLLKKS